MDRASRKIIRRKRVKELCGDPSDASLWRWQRNGTFPQSVQITEAMVGWYEDEVLAWQAARIRAPGARRVQRPKKAEPETLDAAD